MEKPRYCKLCGNPLVTRGTQYCSPHCAAVAREAARDRPTHQSAATVRSRVARHVPLVVCAHCGSTSHLSRHHPDIVHRPDDVVVLCRRCHLAADLADGTRQPRRPRHAAAEDARPLPDWTPWPPLVACGDGPPVVHLTGLHLAPDVVAYVVDALGNRVITLPVDTMTPSDALRRALTADKSSPVLVPSELSIEAHAAARAAARAGGRRAVAILAVGGEDPAPTRYDPTPEDLWRREATRRAAVWLRSARRVDVGGSVVVWGRRMGAALSGVV